MSTHVSNHSHITTIDLVRQEGNLNTSNLGVKRRIDQADDVGGHALAEHHTRQARSCIARGAASTNGNVTASKIVNFQPTGGALSTEDSSGPILPISGPSQHPRLSLKHPDYSLPTRLVENFEKLGVSAIFPWQSSCLLGRGLLEGQHNLVYTAPTGGGKSLVADVLMLKRIVQQPGLKAILVLPYVALVQEKLKWLRHIVDGVQKHFPQDVDDEAAPLWKRLIRDVRVAGFFGGSKTKSTWADCDIGVCTIEKANSLINTAVEEGNIDALRVFVIDEIHMLDDAHRGYLIELMITKLLCLGGRCQIICMSGTLSNPKLLATWLRAKFYVSKYRPIPIQEYVVYDNCIYPTTDLKQFFRSRSSQNDEASPRTLPQPSHQIEASIHKELGNSSTNATVALAVETAQAGYGALVFCNSRHGVQTMASLISDTNASGRDSPVYDRRLDVLTSLQALPGGCESLFAKTVPAGVGFHHAGLTTEEREIIAEAYDAGIIKIMVATCSLAAGINLPARRVILCGAKMGRDFVGPAMLRQMQGRAGRKGKDEVGETFLCCQKEELEIVAGMMEADLPPVVSTLTPEKRGIKRAILEIISIRLASSYDSLLDYVQNSLLWLTSDHNMVLEMLDAAITNLLKEELILAITNNAYAPTRLGCAIVASGLSPEDGLFVHADLRRAISSFVMDTEFHIFYLFTPIPQLTSQTPLTSDISWPVFRTLLHTLDEASLRALLQIGIKPAIVNDMANSGLSDLKQNTQPEIDIARIYRRAYSTFALRDLCNEIPIHTVALKYNLPRGTIQNLAQSCHGFAAGMIKFCQRMAQSVPMPTVHDPSNLSGNNNDSSHLTCSTSTLDPNAAGFSMLSAVLEHMQDRLQAGARADLLEMAQVTFVKGRMARMLYENGFKGVRALADADPRRDILPVMMGVSGWKRRPRHGESQAEWDERRTKLEAKLLTKAEVLVRSAALIWERDCQRLYVEEE